ncbi:prepilin-type N-terminal cleavage/methylation domain-containing protein [bacterium]|nr:prepilin-type N-terminal cleavage/methylation domain-containing protein [bacterium]
MQRDTQGKFLKMINVKGNQSAFSLIELAIILAIIGILAVIAIPNIMEMSPRIRLNNAAQGIATDLQFARIRSITIGKECRLNFNVSEERYTIEEGNRSSGSTSWTTIADQEERKFNDSSNIYYHKHIDIQSVSQNPIFTPKGLSSTTTVIQIQNDRGNRKNILVNIAGRIKISHE